MQLERIWLIVANVAVFPVSFALAITANMAPTSDSVQQKWVCESHPRQKYRLTHLFKYLCLMEANNFFRTHTQKYTRINIWVWDLCIVHKFIYHHHAHFVVRKHFMRKLPAPFLVGVVHLVICGCEHRPQLFYSFSIHFCIFWIQFIA